MPHGTSAVPMHGEQVCQQVKQPVHPTPQTTRAAKSQLTPPLKSPPFCRAARGGGVTKWRFPPLKRGGGVDRTTNLYQSTPPPCISYANVQNYYGPYAHCSLDKGAACAQHIPPPPPCANTGQVLVPGPKVRKHGVPVFGQARVSARHVLRNTSCRLSPTLTRG